MRESISTAYIDENGQFSLPHEFCELNHLQTGDPITLIHFGNCLILSPESTKEKNQKIKCPEALAKI